MKKILALVAAASFFSGSASAVSDLDRAAAASETDKALRSSDAQMKEFFKARSENEHISGKQWLELSAGDREKAVVHSMAELSERGIVFGRRPEEYAADIEQILKSNVSRQSERLTNLLAAVLYETEPDSRAALDEFRTDARS